MDFIFYLNGTDGLYGIIMKDLTGVTSYGNLINDILYLEKLFIYDIVGIKIFS
jgi:hypothetical protein